MDVHAWLCNNKNIQALGLQEIYLSAWTYEWENLNNTLTECGFSSLHNNLRYIYLAMYKM